MVRLRVTGPTSFDWISTKYDINYNASCLTTFSESCYVGGNAGKVSYLVRLVAEPEGAIISSLIIKLLRLSYYSNKFYRYEKVAAFLFHI